jgi:hypothetical protein
VRASSGVNFLGGFASGIFGTPYITVAKRNTYNENAERAITNKLRSLRYQRGKDRPYLTTQQKRHCTY